MTPAALIALAIQSILQLARQQGINENEIKLELVRLRGESETAHGKLNQAIADALKEGDKEP